jgi:ArsR family transcriptional regulator
MPRTMPLKMSRDLTETAPDARLLKRLAALAEPHRLAVVRLLIEGGEIGVGEICAAIGDISQPSMSRHLGTLSNAEIIVGERRAQRVFYRLHGSVRGLAEDLAALSTELLAALGAAA